MNDIDVADLSVGRGTRMGTSSEAFEYAIKKDVRNNPIVREVDERRLQEQWRSVAVGVLFVGVLLFSGWQRVELLQHGYRVEQMQKERGDEEEINRHLRLEIETLKSPQRIEMLATRRSAARGARDRRGDRHRARRAARAAAGVGGGKGAGVIT